MPEEGNFSKSEIEAAFINGHWSYGSVIHEHTADALVAALGAASEPTVGHALFSRLFAEYAASLETYAAWAWALRNRSAPGSFLDGYLAYTNRNVRDFYALIRKHEGDLSSLLNLPSAAQIVEATLVRHQDIPEDERADLPEEGYRAALDSAYERLKQGAERYFADDRILIDTYNKTKHGAPMLRLFDTNNARKFEVVMRNPVAGQQGEAPYRFAGFTVDRAEIEKMANNVHAMTLSIRDLASLTKVLLDAGVLYDEGVPER
jgi:hypothetical protein